MQLEQLRHWRLVGTPDVFRERRDGEEWWVIHSGGRPAHHAGFLQTVRFERAVETVWVSVVASLFTAGGGLMLRLGVDPTGGVSPLGRAVRWSGWHGPDNGWEGEPARTLRLSVPGLDTDVVTVFLESMARWPVANTSRWRDVQMGWLYGEGEPEPEPEPEPGPEPGIPGEIAELKREIRELLGQVEARVERVDGLLAEWERGQGVAERVSGRD